MSAISVGVQGAALPRRDRAHEVELVVDLVQQAEVPADAGAVHLAGDEHDGEEDAYAVARPAPAL